MSMSVPVPTSLPLTPGRRAWRRLRRQKAAMFGMIVTAVFLFTAVFAPWLAPYGLLDIGDSFVPPSPEHWLGTDSLGSDVLSNIIYGARTSLIVGVFAMATSSVIGITLGSIAGYFGGWVDDALMRLTELFQILPQFFLAIVIVALFGSSIWNIVLVIGILAWPVTARLIRAEFLTLKRRDFVEAARSLGMSDRDIIIREILPNALPPIIVNGTLQISGAILLETSLAFLGLGDPNIMSWGTMLHNAQEFFNRAWWMAAFPGFALFLATLSLNLIGDGLNDALNPKR
ncbi:ABC transporter permease [Ancylobacter sp. Lp-2]|uniref:ABC transporter permease n=1 Tax=Ancylobacter sp. Lp-2 TaxID=2881339 RepID=UPI001E4F1606|nr:ABC transporter permease [Ancylobacter sp. Lp-2]MCB4771251.1 ABC transporter permease [Ancylobacter sp. Lp-2]